MLPSIPPPPGPLIPGDAVIDSTTIFKGFQGSSPVLNYNENYNNKESLNIPYNFTNPSESYTNINFFEKPFSYIRVNTSFAVVPPPALRIDSCPGGLMFFFEVDGTNDITLSVSIDSNNIYKSKVFSPGNYIVFIPPGIPPLTNSIEAPLYILMN